MKLFDYLRAHKLTAQAFAFRAGVPTSTITRIIGGKSPNIKTVQKIDEASGGKVEPRDFYRSDAA